MHGIRNSIYIGCVLSVRYVTYVHRGLVSLKIIFNYVQVGNTKQSFITLLHDGILRFIVS